MKNGLFYTGNRALLNVISIRSLNKVHYTAKKYILNYLQQA